MTTVRKAAVAGWFYPADPCVLKGQLEGFLAQAKRPALPTPKAVIAPHAGYVYSGPVAASAYAALIPARNDIRRVVLLGPAHRLGFRGLALAAADEFETPLGGIAVDAQAVHAISRMPQVVMLDAAHVQEHSLEVHLPFLQSLFSDFTLVPLVVGEATANEVAEVIETLWGGDETLIVVSSDLSHYLDYDAACVRDRATSQAIVELRYQDLQYEDACGRIPVSGLLRVARQRHLTVRAVDLRNSGDTAGGRDRVVGYGAYLVS